MTYEEYKESRKKLEYVNNPNLKCIVGGCVKKAEYEIGDARFYCGGCEEHAHIKEDYERLCERKVTKNIPPKPNFIIDYTLFDF